MKFFEQQCMEDSHFTPGAYIYDIMPLPRNDREADLLLRKFEEDASRWGQYEYDEDYDNEEPNAATPSHGYTGTGFGDMQGFSNGNNGPLFL